MKVTFENLLQMKPALEEIINIDLPFKTAYKISTIASIADRELKFYQQQIQMLLDKYAQRDENGNIKRDDTNNYLIQADLADEFKSKFDELLCVEINGDMPKLSTDELENLQIKPKLLMSLSPIIE